jgi:hypothetical protein
MKIGLFRGIGIILLVIGFALFAYVFFFEYRAKVAEGRIVEMIKTSTGNTAKPWTFTPVVSYTVKGDNRTFLDTSAVYSYVPEYRIGASIKVFYNRDHPEKAIFGGVRGYMGSIIVSSVGLIFLCFTFFSYRRRKWRIEL